jgi:hypothetical protein
VRGGHGQSDGPDRAELRSSGDPALIRAVVEALQGLRISRVSETPKDASGEVLALSLLMPGDKELLFGFRDGCFCQARNSFSYEIEGFAPLLAAYEALPLEKGSP